MLILLLANFCPSLSLNCPVSFKLELICWPKAHLSKMYLKLATGNAVWWSKYWKIERRWKYVFCMVLPEALWNYDIEGADAFTNICVPFTHIYNVVCKIVGVCPTWYKGTLLQIFLDAEKFLKSGNVCLYNLVNCCCKICCNVLIICSFLLQEAELWKSDSCEYKCCG